MRVPTQNREFPITAIAVAASVAFFYASVLVKLGRDWWSDENYSHGLLVPFVIAFVVWGQRDLIAGSIRRSNAVLAWTAVTAAVFLLLVGTLAAELFTQRMSLVLMLAAVVFYFFGRKALELLVVPFALLLFAIPVPQIVFNRIALPLQSWATQLAVFGIRAFDVPALRNGNVIAIVPKGGIHPILLEVVEACSGIRSLMTLITLGLVLAYFTRTRDNGGFANLTRSDLARAALLMIAAAPIAVLTNAGRVAATGLMTYGYGKQATEATVHDVSGWLVYVVALVILVGANIILKRILPQTDARVFDPEGGLSALTRSPMRRALPLIFVLVVTGIGVNWFANRSETVPDRRPLSDLTSQLGGWRQRGIEFKFSKDVEDVLRASDYTMREYTGPDGRIANLYVGYYATQRTGATYHSPQNCLPGAGWRLSSPDVVTVTTPQGRTFTANRYILENGIYREIMLYWYQGRGHIEPSEYRDKLNTIIDSVTRRRTDGAMVRVMTDMGSDEAAAQAAVSDLAGRLEDQLPAFIPE